jgi:hypothetical protein
MADHQIGRRKISGFNPALAVDIEGVLLRRAHPTLAARATTLDGSKGYAVNLNNARERLQDLVERVTIELEPMKVAWLLERGSYWFELNFVFSAEFILQPSR